MNSLTYKAESFNAGGGEMRRSFKILSISLLQPLILAGSKNRSFIIKVSASIMLMLFLFLYASPFVFAQQPDGRYILSQIYRIRDLIAVNFYKPVYSAEMVRGAFSHMAKVHPHPSFKNPGEMTWSNFEARYLAAVNENPSLAGRLGEAALDGMVESLRDPYSVLLTPSKKAVLEGGDGSGIGVEMGYKEGKVIVIAPLTGSPAEKAGLRSGDHITAVNGRSTAGMSLYNVSMLISGRQGEKIDITVNRSGGTFTFSPVFAPLNIEPIEYHLLNNNIGYIRIRIFDGKIIEKFNYAFNIMKQRKVKGLILDLRNNPGGDFLEALLIAAKFVPQGRLVWIIKRGQQPEPKESSSGGSFNAPVVVLINEGSASASEVLAAALRENNKAVLMGRKTFGKGVVQTLFDMPGGAVLHLTTEKYLTPAKKDINFVGISPDIPLSDALQHTDPTKDGFVIEAWKHLNKGK